MTTPDDVLLAAHRHSSDHRDEIQRSTICGCFFCEQTFAPDAIVEWCHEGRKTPTIRRNVTAICPNCGVDAVIGDASGFPITTDFLADMYWRWFAVAPERK